MWAVLPIKDLAEAKARLAPALSAEERRALFFAMAEDVLSTLARVTVFDGIAVVTGDAGGASLAQRYGARIINQPENRGQSAAVSAAATLLAGEGVDGLLQVPGDVPLVRPEDIERVLTAHRPAPSVTIVPSHDRRGSNCVACSPADCLRFQFGNDSFVPHLATARDAGIAPTVLRLPRLALNVDAPDDLAAFLARPSDTRAYAYLQDSGIAARFAPLAQVSV